MRSAARNRVGHRASQHGFTLIEIAVAVLVITLLLGSLLVPLTTQVEQRQISEAERRLAEIKEALIGFAAINGYLPCPAISATDGTEDRTAGACTLVGGNPKRNGILPWVTLGVPPLDPWGNLYRYSVDPEFADINVITLDAKGDIVLRSRNAAGAAINLTNATVPEIPVVVLSHGGNGHGATGEGGVVRATRTGWGTGQDDEFTNATSATEFWVRTRTTNPAATGKEFDDIVVWISPNVLMARMVAAGRLP
ncbi:MAG TPA: prepilin-type N-terminal cleavage/methylation domain-containing protein [Burkholderiales bacterium]|nr:prepilin-type N-terminal cleavage/methylation domain-containing protein [Burkholderiales bacterium]